MLDPDERASWLKLLPTLAPGADARPAIAFFEGAREACLAELGAVPGHDGVRAGLVRLLPAVVADADARRGWLDAAERGARSLLDGELEGVEAARRHPAWAGLCLIEVATQRGEGSGLDAALSLARSAFARTASDLPRGDGEILWALAEVAADVGWTDHVDPLLEAAARSRFADAENLGRVVLLQVMRALSEGLDAGPGVDALLALPELDDRTHAHALWIGAHLDREAGRIERALERLEAALGVVDAEEEPEVAERIRSAIAAWGGHAERPAEA